MERNEEIKQESNGKLIILIIALLILIFVVIGITIVTVTYTNESNSSNTITTGNLSLEFIEDTNGISITDAYPISDEVGKKLSDENQYFDFTVNATIDGIATINYEISASKTETSTLSDDSVKLYLEKKENGAYQEVMAPKTYTPISEDTALGTPSGNMILTTGSTSKSINESYRLKMWVNSNAEVTDIKRTFSVQVAIYGKIDTERGK